MKKNKINTPQINTSRDTIARKAAYQIYAQIENPAPIKVTSIETVIQSAIEEATSNAQQRVSQAWLKAGAANEIESIAPFRASLCSAINAALAAERDKRIRDADTLVLRDNTIDELREQLAAAVNALELIRKAHDMGIHDAMNIAAAALARCQQKE